MTFGFKKNNTGYTLVEMIIYIFILSLLLLLIINILLSIVSSQTNIKTNKRIESAAIVSLERMIREIRNATSVDDLNSTFGSNPGILQLNTTDNLGAAKTVQFFASTSVLSVKENGIYTGPLTSVDVTVTSLIFRKIDSGNSKAVKIELIFQTGVNQYQKSVPFYSTVILRGSY